MCGGSGTDADADGICDDVDLCTDMTACNYDANPTAACATNDACGVCGGAGTDADADGVCDDVDLCADTTACNYDNSANEACQMEDACGVCGGTGTDIDSDGICDDSDNCTETNACNYDDSANETCSYPTTYYQDADSDGLGNASMSDDVCSDTPPSGYVENSTDNCDNILAENYDDVSNPACTFAGPNYQAVDSLLLCEGTTLTLDLDTLNDGSASGTWSYSLNGALDAFGSATISGSVLTVDGSASGTGRDTLSVSGAGNSETADLTIIVQESTYPVVTEQYLVLPSTPAALDGGCSSSLKVTTMLRSLCISCTIPPTQPMRTAA